MSASTTYPPLAWDQLALTDVEFISLRLSGSVPGSVDVQVTYDRGCVLATTGAGTATSATRVLSLGEVRALLEALRVQARVTPRPRAVDSAALSAFVGALARLVHSPGPIPFSTAVFGAVRRLPSGAIVGEVAIDAGMTTSLHDVSGVLSHAAHPARVSPARPRKLTVAQLRALIGALAARRATAAPPLDELWLEVLKDAIAQSDAVENALATARGTLGAQSAAVADAEAADDALV
jgi:hypothetical protein